LFPGIKYVVLKLSVESICCYKYCFDIFHIALFPNICCKLMCPSWFRFENNFSSFGIFFMNEKWKTLISRSFINLSSRNYMAFRPGVNFFNILPTNVSYKHLFSNFSLVVHVSRKRCWKDFCTKNLHVKCWWNWPQYRRNKYRFTSLLTLITV